MIALENLKELLTAEPAEKKPAPHLAKLEPAFARTLATTVTSDDEPPPPPHTTHQDLTHQLMVSAALQMVQGHAAIQTINVASAVSLTATAAKAPAFATTDSGAIQVVDAGTPSESDAATASILASFTEALGRTSSDQAPHVSAPQHTAHVHAGELVQLVAKHVQPNQPRVELILQPPELGKLHLEVEVRNSDVHVRVTAESRDVARVLSDTLPQLELALREQGLKVGSVSVSTASADADTQTDDSGHRSASDERPERVEAIEQNPPKQQGQRKKRGLDVLA